MKSLIKGRRVFISDFLTITYKQHNPGQHCNEFKESKCGLGFYNQSNYPSATKGTESHFNGRETKEYCTESFWKKPSEVMLYQTDE